MATKPVTITTSVLLSDALEDVEQERVREADCRLLMTDFQRISSMCSAKGCDRGMLLLGIFLAGHRAAVLGWSPYKLQPSQPRRRKRPCK